MWLLSLLKVGLEGHQRILPSHLVSTSIFLKSTSIRLRNFPEKSAASIFRLVLTVYHKPEDHNLNSHPCDNVKPLEYF